jgi:hypothetical protein
MEKKKKKKKKKKARTRRITARERTKKNQKHDTIKKRGKVSYPKKELS